MYDKSNGNGLSWWEHINTLLQWLTTKELLEAFCLEYNCRFTYFQIHWSKLNKFLPFTCDVQQHNTNQTDSVSQDITTFLVLNINYQIKFSSSIIFAEKRQVLEIYIYIEKLFNIHVDTGVCISSMFI